MGRNSNYSNNDKKNEMIAGRIYNLRKNLGLTQKEVAEKLGVAHTLVSSWENCEKKISADKCKKLSQIFGVPVSYLLCSESDECEFIKLYNELSDTQKNEILAQIKNFQKK